MSAGVALYPRSGTDSRPPGDGSPPATHTAGQTVAQRRGTAALLSSSAMDAMKTRQPSMAGEDVSNALWLRILDSVIPDAK